MLCHVDCISRRNCTCIVCCSCTARSGWLMTIYSVAALHAIWSVSSTDTRSRWACQPAAHVNVFSARKTLTGLCGVCTARIVRLGASPGCYRDNTVLPATRHGWTHPALTVARQAGTRCTYPEGWKAKLTWLVDHIPGWFTCTGVYIIYTLCSEKQRPILSLSISSPNTIRFSWFFFHWHILWKIWSNAVMKYFTTP